MHVVTKILVVFCAVLSLLLAALTMAYAANAGEVRAAFKAEEAQKLAAIAVKDDVVSQANSQRADDQKKTDAATQLANGRQAEITNLQAERTELRTQVEQLKAASEGINNRIVQLSAAVDTQAEIIKNYRDEVTKLRDEGLAASRREIELVDRINDLESQVEVTTANVRALKEQLAEAQLALQTAKDGGNKAGDGVIIAAGPLIQARVLEVFRSPAGEAMAVISEGSNRNIKKNMELNITRGDQFIGTLMVVTVEPQKAVGKINTFGKPVEVKPQDMILSRLQQ